MKLITNKDQSTEAAIFLLNKRYGNLKVYRDKNYPDSVFYYNPENKQILMELDLKNQKLWVRYGEIWSFLITLFDYNILEIQKVIEIWMEKTYNLKGLTPRPKPGIWFLDISNKNIR